MKLVTALFIAFTSLTSAQPEIAALEFGAIAGQVADQTGKPVGGVRVFALPMEKPDISGKVMSTVSGQDGTFLLNRVQTGLNMICFEKEAELYADTRFAVSTDDITLNPLIRVKRDETTTDVAIRLGRKGQQLLLGLSPLHKGFKQEGSIHAQVFG